MSESYYVRRIKSIQEDYANAIYHLEEENEGIEGQLQSLALKLNDLEEKFDELKESKAQEPKKSDVDTQKIWDNLPKCKICNTLLTAIEKNCIPCNGANGKRHPESDEKEKEDNRGAYELAADKEEMRALLNHLEDAGYDIKWPSSFKVELSPYLLKKIGSLTHEYLIKILKEELNK